MFSVHAMRPEVQPLEDYDSLEEAVRTQLEYWWEEEEPLPLIVADDFKNIVVTLVTEYQVGPCEGFVLVINHQKRLIDRYYVRYDLDDRGCYQKTVVEDSTP
jgi:hypothetical protein